MKKKSDSITQQSGAVCTSALSFLGQTGLKSQLWHFLSLWILNCNNLGPFQLIACQRVACQLSVVAWKLFGLCFTCLGTVASALSPLASVSIAVSVWQQAPLKVECVKFSGVQWLAPTPPSLRCSPQHMYSSGGSHRFPKITSWAFKTFRWLASIYKIKFGSVCPSWVTGIPASFGFITGSSTPTGNTSSI